MTQYIYTGDPTPNKKKAGAAHGPNSDGAVTYTNPATNQKVTFKAGVATEAPAWLEPRLKNNTHFKAVEKKAA
jgi:hypothetical protein